MNETDFQRGSVSESPGEPLPATDRQAAVQDDGPRFGALDIVDAFTAMRHEWRGQTKESRLVAELIQAAVTNIQSMEAKLLARIEETRTAHLDSLDAAGAKPLVLMIVETDHQLSRAVAAVAQWETNRRLRAQADADAVERYFARMNGLARWLARPLLTFVTEQRAARETSLENAAMEGLNLVLARLRRGMQEQSIERVDVLGMEFDAETMRAVGSVATAEYPSGHVAEQYSPAYCWQGRLLRFAEVRVAQ